MSNGVNDTRFKDLETNVKEWGRDSAMGKDALPKLAVAVVRAAADGVIDLEKNKHGDGVDDAKYFYGKYVEAEGKKAVHERTVGGLKANESKVRTMLKYGLMTTIDPVAGIEQAHILHSELQRAGEKVQPAFAAYVNVARTQLDPENSDNPLTDEQIKAACRKKEAEPKDLEKELNAIHKKMESLITGENKHGLKDQSPELIQAEELIRTRLAALLTHRETAAAFAVLAKHGVTSVGNEVAA